METFVNDYDSMISSGSKTYRNYKLLRGKLSAKLFRSQWVKARGKTIEGINLPDAQKIRLAVNIPVLCTGGFQTASVIRDALTRGFCDAVTIARPLVANNDLAQMFARGMDRPPKPCTYCNKCLVNVIKHPIGCYEEERFASHDAMIEEIMSVFQPPPFAVPSQPPAAAAGGKP